VGALLKQAVDDADVTAVAPASLQLPMPWWRKLGPGLITGAADDDPSGIATYSQAGAQFGFGLLWTLLFTYPLMAGIQMVSARIGRVTGHGLATNIRRHYPRWLLYSVVGMLLLANIINIAADLAAMGEALALVAGGPAHLYAVLFALFSALLQICVPYVKYVRVLKWLTMALLAYVATLFIVHIPWQDVWRLGITLPPLPWSGAFVTTMVAVFGTTISPYLFFWQASQEVEDMRADPAARPLRSANAEARTVLSRIKLDTCVGMAFSNLVAFCIVMTTALTLHVHGITDIASSAQAAQALRPIAGEFAFALFSMGIIGTGLLAIPVLAGSAGYAMAGTFKWPNSLEATALDDRYFYLVIFIATLGGVALIFAPIDAVKALYWSAVINGVISVPIMAVMLLLGSRRDVMGELAISLRLKVVGWICTLVMALAVVAMIVTQLAATVA
jgi:NRAMP (natural resistance-associated macrophage protein)-like metal ion transporter